MPTSGTRTSRSLCQLRLGLPAELPFKRKQQHMAADELDYREFDVAVVGASVAGCTAARLFAQGGVRVALIESRSDPAAYKGDLHERHLAAR